MSNFNCDKCGAVCSDSELGYVTGCEHSPPDINAMNASQVIAFYQSIHVSTARNMSDDARRIWNLGQELWQKGQ